MSAGMLELENLAIGFGDAAFDFSFTASPGEWLAVAGPSGAGKTTLLNLIGGFLAPEGGVLRFSGRNLIPLAPATRPVTTLFQDHNLFAHMTADENVGLGLDSGLRLSASQKKTVSAALSRVGLEGRNGARPGDLSGGERQRVALARALVRQRPVLLLDEPLSQLDPSLRLQTLRLIADIHREYQLTILMVLHTPDEAAAFVDRYIFVETGTVAATFSPAQFKSRQLPQGVLAYLGEGDNKGGD